MYYNYLLHYKSIKAYTPGMPARRAGVSVVLYTIAAAIVIAAEVTVAVLLPPSSQLPSPCRRRAIVSRLLLLPCYCIAAAAVFEYVQIAESSAAYCFA